MSVVFGGGQGVLQYLCCADDEVRFLQHIAEEVLLLAVSTDLDQLVLFAQVRVKLFGVMLFHQMYL